MSTTTATKSDAQIKRTKKFKALVAVGLDENEAIKSYRRTVLGEGGEAVEADPVAELVAAGFTEAEARSVLGLDEVPGAMAPAPTPIPEPEPEPEVDPIAALIIKHGFDFAKGRVYLGADAIEAAVRVRKTGQPEIVASSRANTRRPRAVVAYAGTEGEVIIQNLIREA